MTLTFTFKKFIELNLISLMALMYGHCAYANDDNVLTVYTRNTYIKKDGPSKYLEKLFYSKYKTKIRWISVDRTVNIKKDIQARPDVDVIMGMSSLDMNSLVYAGNLIEINSYNHQNTVVDTKHYNSKYYIPFERFQLSFIYNKNQIKNPPKTIPELINNNNYTFIIEDPATSQLGLDLLYWINTISNDDNTDNTKKLPTTLYNHSILSTDRNAAFNKFLLGNGDFVLDYSTRPSVEQLTKPTSPYKAVMFEDGNLEIHKYVAIDYNSRKINLASKFVDMLLSPSGQKIMSYKHDSYPVLAQDINLLQLMTQYKTTPIYINTEKFTRELPILQQTWGYNIK